MIEVWKDVVGFEFYYEVSNTGYIRRKAGSSHLKPKNLKMRYDADGYCRVNLKVKQKSNSKFFHRIIAMAFLDNPENKPQVNHINGIKHDNRLENLEWATRSENRVHAYRTGLQTGKSRQGIKCNFHKLTEMQVKDIRKRYHKRVVTMKELAKEYSVSEACINNIISKKNWGWLQ
jgi:hypothetical protein